MNPSVEYGVLSPMLIVFGAALLGVLVEAFAPARHRYRMHLVLALGGLVAGFVAVVALRGTRSVAVMGSVVIDGPALFLQGTLLLIAVPAVLTMAERHVEAPVQGRLVDAFSPQASAVPGSLAEREASKAGVAQTEVFPLTMFAVGGMMLFPASNDLLTMFVALEVFSLPLYLLCGLARHRRLMSQEASLKYFLLGAFSSAFFLFGVAMIYGYAGTLELSGIADVIAAQGSDSLILLGAALLSVGLLFKVGAVPFHSWVPDVYQGAPTPITGFMAAATKVAAFGAILRIFYVALPEIRTDLAPMLWGVAILTMVVGAVVAVTQTDIKRMLAYSSVAHAGFILTGVVAGNAAGLSGTLFYLVVYGFGTLGAFGVLTLVRDQDGEVTQMLRWAGLGKRSPLVASMFALFLLSFAGIPLTSGFVGKFAVFRAAIEAHASALVIVGVLCSAVAAYFYVRIIVLMFFTDSSANPPEIVMPSVMTKIAIGVGVVVTVVGGIFPQPLLDLAEHAGSLIG